MALTKVLILLCVSWAAMSMPTNNAGNNASAIASAEYNNASVPLVTFDGSASTHFDFTEADAPHSGWRMPAPNSNATWDVTDGHGILDGEINVEWNDNDADAGLESGWPGYVRSTANGTFPDASSVSGGALILMARSSTPEYKGFHVSFGTTEKWSTTKEACSPDLGPFKNRGCYKAAFMVPAGGDFAPVRIPFSSFNGAWLFGNGNVATGYSCSEKKENCLTSKSLARIKSIDLWAEGVEGKVHLEVKSLTASP
jgi:hypothetical protein